MPISVRCPKCGHGYQLRDELAGKQAKCRCGQTLAIPVATTLTSLLDEEHIGQSADELGAAMPPAGVSSVSSARSSHKQSSPQFGSAFGKKKKKFGKGKNNQAVIIGSVVGGVAVLFVVLLLVFLLTSTDDKPAVAAAPRPPAPASAAPSPVASLPGGQTTPQETFDSYKTAWIAGDWDRVYALMTPEAQTSIISILAMMGAGLGPVCPELSAVAKQHGVEPMGLEALGSMPSDDSDPFGDNAVEPAKSDVGSLIAQVAKVGDSVKDKRAFFIVAMPVFVKFLQSEQLATIDKLGGASLSASLNRLPIISTTTTLSGLQINGSTANGFAGTTPVQFNQRSGNWYIDAMW